MLDHLDGILEKANSKEIVPTLMGCQGGGGKGGTGRKNPGRFRQRNDSRWHLMRDTPVLAQRICNTDGLGTGWIHAGSLVVTTVPLGEEVEGHLGNFHACCFPLLGN